MIGVDRAETPTVPAPASQNEIDFAAEIARLGGKWGAPKTPKRRFSRERTKETSS